MEVREICRTCGWKMRYFNVKGYRGWMCARNGTKEHDQCEAVEDLYNSTGMPTFKVEMDKIKKKYNEKR